MKSLILYDSLGGNTRKAAAAIHTAVKERIPDASLVRISKDIRVDLLDHDLVFIGSPVIDWLPTKKMTDFVKSALKACNEKGCIKPSAPIIPGKFCICFATFAGPHIGKNEALPMTMWLGSALEHLGFIKLDAWHIVGEFHKETPLNKRGRLGNIENRPGKQDLEVLKNRVRGSLDALSAFLD